RSEAQVDAEVEPEPQDLGGAFQANLAQEEQIPLPSAAESLTPEPEELLLNPAQQSPAASRRRRSRSS
ncbi:MAG: hypothetical protein Q6K92_07950, partial [Thermostichus sp. DG_1_5_bins_95]